MQRTQVNHIALLVPSVAKAGEVLGLHGLPVGPAEAWEGEGTLEIYVGDRETHTGLLLLMEPQKPGAYTRAMEKRGPGLHHIAIDVTDLESFVDETAGSGWFLHPKSLKTIHETKTAYLARPGVPMLIEVQQRDSLGSKTPLISKIEVPLTHDAHKLLSAIGIRDLFQPNGQGLWISTVTERFSFESLISRL